MAAEGQGLSDAAFHGDIAAIDRLLESGARIDAKDGDGFTALHRACVTGNVEVVQHLLGKGAKVNEEDAYGDSPLHYACFCGHEAVVKALVAAGADAMKKSNDGKTPVQSAAEEGHMTTLDYLLTVAPPAPGSTEEAEVRKARERAATRPRAESGSSVGSSGADGGGRIAGLDFSKGVLIEGELHKKRANKVIKWRHKYYVLSAHYGALFFWTGSRTTVEGVIKKVRFETFFAVRQHMDKHGGRRFDIKVVTGRVMELLAASTAEADSWVKTIKKAVGPFMGAVRFQSLYRGFRARKRLKAMRLARDRAVGAAFSGAASGGGGGGRGDGEGGVLMEGVLKKKVSKISASLLSAYRTRYFVLDASERALLYYDTKWMAKMKKKPRAIPLVSLLSVDAPRTREGSFSNRFYVRVATGRTWTFEAADADEVSKWVSALQRVLPRENIAAIRIQSAFRGLVARKAYKDAKASTAAALAEAAEKYGKPQEVLDSAVRKIQALGRMVAARRKYRTTLANRKLAERRALEIKKHRLYLRAPRKAAGAASSAPATEVSEGHKSRMARLRRLRELREKKERGETDGDGDGDGGAPPPPPPSDSEWEKHVDDESGRPFWFNKNTGTTTWIDPTAERIGDWVEVPQPDGKSYWLNEKTKATRWDRPPAEEGASAEKGKPAWVAQKDADTGQLYFANRETGDVQWEKPDIFDRQFLPRPAGLNCAKWYKEKDEDTGMPYFVSALTGDAVWQQPEDYDGEGAKVADAGKAAEPDWVKVKDTESGKYYWYSPGTGERSWKDPNKKEEEEEKEKKAKAKARAKRRRSTMSKKRLTRKRSSKISSAQLEAIQKAAAKKKKQAERGVGRRGGEGESGMETKVEDDLPEGWSKEMDPATNKHYYFNSMTGESRWERPGVDAGTDEEEDASDKWDSSETFAFQNWINESLGEDADLSEVMPLDTGEDPPPVLEAVRNGVLLAKLVNAVAPGTLDERVLDKTASAVGEGGGADGARADEEAHFFANVDENPALANCQLSLSAAQSIGAFVGADVSAADLEAGRAAPVLDLIWALWKRSLMEKVSVRHTPGLVRLADASKNERVADLLQLAPEVLLLRWCNFHLRTLDKEDWTEEGASEVLQVKAIGSDLADGIKLAALLRVLAPEHAEYLPVSLTQAHEMEQKDVVGNALWVANQIGVPPWFTVEGVTEANVRLLLALLATLFNVRPGLDTGGASDDSSGTGGAGGGGKGGIRRGRGSSAASTDRDLKELQDELEQMMSAEEKESELGREGTMLKAWMNSLDVHGVFVRDLVQDLRDGTVLLKVFDAVEPGLVKWSKVDLAPRNRYKRVENGNMVIQIAKTLDFHVVNVSGLDIVDGSSKMIAGITSQLMRHHLYKMLSALAFEGFSATPERILEWANDKVEASTEDASCRIGGFTEPTLATGVYLAHVINQVRPIVDWDMVADGATEEECMANAKLLISLARMIGAAVYVAPEDIVQVRSKSIEIFLAALIVAERKLRAGVEGDMAAFGASIEEEDEDDSSDEEGRGVPSGAGLTSHRPAAAEAALLHVQDGGVDSSDDEDEGGGGEG